MTEDMNTPSASCELATIHNSAILHDFSYFLLFSAMLLLPLLVLAISSLDLDSRRMWTGPSRTSKATTTKRSSPVSSTEPFWWKCFLAKICGKWSSEPNRFWLFPWRQPPAFFVRSKNKLATKDWSYIWSPSPSVWMRRGHSMMPLELKQHFARSQIGGTLKENPFQTTFEATSSNPHRMNSLTAMPPRSKSLKSCWRNIQKWEQFLTWQV